MTQVTNPREAGAEGMQHVWVFQVEGSDGTVADPVVCATRDVAVSRSKAKAAGTSLAWKEDEYGASSAYVGTDLFTIFATPVHQF